jgi:UDP-2,4-diacetamido-2,4,6-trideoxy-beta-L-altropyranose hydrolase
MATAVAFRVDSSRAIGTGHVFRCLTLAGALARRGAACRFVCRDLPGALTGLIEAAGYPVHLLPSPTGDAAADGNYAAWLGVGWEQDAAETAAALAAGADWLVVDHYALDARWEARLRDVASRLLVIDDLADRRHDCDVLLDQQAVDGMAERYRGLLPDRCTVLLGPRYALLRPDFARRRADGLRDRAAPVARLLVFFGGADTLNFGLRTIEALDSLASDGLALDLVVGLANPHAAALAAAAAARPWLTLHPGDSEMSALMAEADLMIGGAGTTIWERCALGLPAIAVAMADNQQPGAAYVARDGAMLFLGDAETVDGAALGAAVQTLLASPWLRAHMAARAAALVDGKGADRVAGVLLAGAVTLRRAGPADAARILEWRNAPATRAVSGNGEEIDAAGHQAWFARVLADPQRHLLIGEKEGDGIGCLRFDCEADRATVSIFLAPDRIGEGLGPALLAAGIDWLAAAEPACRRVEAEVKAGHEPSHRLFLNAGFTPAASRYCRPLR